MLRSLVLANLLFGAAAVLRASASENLWFEWLLVAAFGEPALILSLAALCAARRALHALGYGPALAAIAAFEVALAWALVQAGEALLPDLRPAPFAHTALLTLLAAGAVLAYFDLRARALSPAVAEARIQALQARIRPHFLYNSINAVLSLIRSEPRRAERALEDLADLFRVLMAENRTLVPVAREIELARQYLAIEEIRLGERLRVHWDIERLPQDALVPPLLLQPLVENAVYHGIEPMEAGGEIRVEGALADGQVVVSVSNPLSAGGRRSTGNGMAVVNIRERLQLHFDAEASLRAESRAGAYKVTLRMPYLTAPTP